MPPYNESSWKRLVENLTADVEFGPPAKEDSLAAVERSLGIPLPRALREWLMSGNWWRI